MNKYRDIFHNSVRNLTKKKGRTILTILSIVIGVSSVVIINSIAECGKFAVNTELESLGMKGISITKSVSNSENRLDAQTLEIIKSQPGVEQAMPVTMLYANLNARNTIMNSLVFGIDSNADTMIALEITYGKGLSRLDVQNRKNVCLIDRELANSLYKRDNITGKSIQLTMKGKTTTFEVVGIVKTGSGLIQNMIGDYIPTMIYIPYTTMQEISGDSNFSQISVTVGKEQGNEQIGNRLIHAIATQTGGESNGYQAEDQMKYRESLSNLMNIVTLVLSLVGFIAMIVASLGIMTIMLVSVNERTREIGIKKAIGASRGNIKLEFLFEAFLLSGIGSLIGLVFGLVTSYIGAAIFGFTFVVNGTVLVCTVGISMVVGGIFGVYPAIKASRLKPVDALRQAD